MGRFGGAGGPEGAAKNEHGKHLLKGFSAHNSNIMNRKTGDLANFHESKLVQMEQHLGIRNSEAESDKEKWNLFEQQRDADPSLYSQNSLNYERQSVRQHRKQQQELQA